MRTETAVMRLSVRSTCESVLIYDHAMSRKVTIIIVVACVLVLAGMWRFLMPESPLDLSREEEPFRSMVLPLKNVVATSYMDGGSITAWVTDRNGTESVITFPYDYDGVISSYPTAYIGGIGDSRTAPFLNNPSRARAILLRLFEEFGNKDDEWYEHTVTLFSEPPSEVFRKFRRKYWRN